MLRLENKRSGGLLHELVAVVLLAALVKAAGIWDWWQSGDKKDRHEPKAELIGYGGAAFGGKTYGLLGLAAMCAWAFPGVQMVFFRRTYSEMEGPGAVMGTAHEIFPSAGAKHRDGGREWYWPNGSQFYFRHCEHEDDVLCLSVHLR